MAGNADWVIDTDVRNLGVVGGVMTVGAGNESNPQQIPTPAQSGITAATPETYWAGAISTWGVSMVKAGHTVQSLPYNGQLTYGNPNNPQDLSNYSVFVMPEPNTMLSSTQKTALINFVSNGGGLFLVSDHDNSDRNGDGVDSVDSLNDLMNNNGVAYNPFGIQFNYNDLIVTSNQVNTDPNDPITHGVGGTVNSFAYHNGASLTIDPSANASAKASIWTSATHTNSNVMVASATYGLGRVVALGDTSPADDGTGDPNDTSIINGWGEASDGAVFLNASAWLASIVLNNESWLNATSSGNAWSSSGNWSGGTTPNNSATLTFDLPSTYSVALTPSAVARKLSVLAGNVTLATGGNTLTLDVGLEVRGGATLTPTGGGTISAPTAAVGGTLYYGGGGGTLNINSGTVNVPGMFTIWNSSGTAVNLSGGTLSVGSLNTDGNPSRLNWTGGTLAFTNDSAIVSSAGGLGATRTLNSGMTLNVSGGSLVVDDAAASNATMTVNTGATVNVGYSITVGAYYGKGTLNVAGGTITGAGGSFESLTVGQSLNHDGSINISSGGQLNFIGQGYVGSFGGVGRVNVSGAGSLLNLGTYFYCGAFSSYPDNAPGDGSLSVTSGGKITADQAYIGYYTGLAGNCVVDGSGSTLEARTSLYLGSAATGTALSIKNGGLLKTGTLTTDVASIASGGGSATLNVQSGATWTHTGLAYVGGDGYSGRGAGVLNINAATVNINGLLTVYDGTGTSINLASGALNVTDGLSIANALNVTGSGSSINATSGGIIDLSHATLSGSAGLTINGSASTLVILPTGFNPATQLAGYNNAGVTSVGNAAIEIPSGTQIVGAGALSQHVNIAPGGSIAQRGSGITLNTGLSLNGAGAAATVTYLTIDDATSGMIGGNLEVSNSAVLGQSQASTFTQTGGAAHIAAYLSVGAATSGTYNLQAGNLACDVNEFIGGGFGAVGAFNQTGGSNTSPGLTVSGYDSAARYRLSGGTLTIGSENITGYGGSQNEMIQTGGTHVVSGALYIASSGPGSYTLSAGNLTAGEEWVGTSYGQGVFTQSGGAHVVSTTLHVGNQYGGGNGLFAFSGGSLTTPTLAIAGGGVFNYDGGSLALPAVDLDGLTSGARLALTPGGNKTLKIGALTMAGPYAQLDVGDNRLVVTNTPRGTWDGSAYTGLTGMIAAGRGDGSWIGSGIVTSMSAAASGNLTTIGIATAGETGRAGGTFGGISVSASDVLIMYTYGGDANLDGKINVDDYTRIDFSVPLGVAGWYNGDFNYDGKINVDDYTIIDFNVGIQGAPFSTGAASGFADATAVPEPGGAVLALGAAAIAGRRRRRRSS